MRPIPFVFALACLAGFPAVGFSQALPFRHKVEVYREKEGSAIVFALRLEQPFLADAFEKSGQLRLQALDRNAYLIYPKEAKFSEKHAEFYGRLRGEGKAKVRLSFEIVSENLDGTRKVEVRQGDIEVAIPAEPGGPAGIFKDWARHQNEHFLSLLNFYPDETFFQYCILQSQSRYGVAGPSLPVPPADQASVEASMYDVFTNSLSIQQSLQNQSLSSVRRGEDFDIHISELKPPSLQSLEYEKLLEERKTKKLSGPKPHEISKLVPADQYFVHFQSMSAFGELLDLSSRWGDSLLRIFALHAVDNKLEAKLQEQLCIRRDNLTRLFADGVVSELVMTGSDPYFLEGTDVTLIFRLKQADAFDKAAAGWLADAKKRHPDLKEMEFNFGGSKVGARYTDDRVVSSFIVRHEDAIIISNSSAAIKKVITTIRGKAPRLYDELDYRYVTCILPPSDDGKSGYLYGSEAFIKRLIGPESKIAEKRRIDCFNNMVMLNNASLFYRLEHGKSPGSLTDLAAERFVDMDRVRCPQGGAYAFDAANDTCTCSEHNRIKYLTPNAELSLLKVSRSERDAYGRYRSRYEELWRTLYDPIALRINVGPTVKIESCVLPFANGSVYKDLQAWVDAKPGILDSNRDAASAFLSVQAMHGKANVAGLLKMLPGVPEVLTAEPTLTDLSWLGDRASLHLCDGSSIFELDPSQLGDLSIPLIGKFSMAQQRLPAVAVALATLPSYVTIEVTDRDKAQRLLDKLAASLFLQRGQVLGLSKSLDAYSLPEYKKHTPYVLSFQLYAVKLRLYAAVVGNRLVAATRADVLREVIDAADNPPTKDVAPAHLMLRLNRRALKKLDDDLQIYWEEKARLACHKNTIGLYNLVKLYDVKIDQGFRLSEAKYGVCPFCPDQGSYSWDDRKDQVECSVHGNRQNSRQNLRLDKKSSFAEFLASIDEITARLRFQDDALISTVEIVRRAEGKK